MKTIYILLRKDTHTASEITSVIGSYSNIDLAQLNCDKHNQNTDKFTTYYISSIEHNDTEDLEPQREYEEVIIEDDYENKFFVDVECEKVSNEHGTGIEASDIKIFGELAHRTKLSDGLKRKIQHEAENVALFIEEKIEA